MPCEICGKKRLVRYSLQSRYRACSRACAAEIGRRAWPRISSIEKAMAKAFKEIGLSPEAQYPIDKLTVDFAFPEKKLAIECDGTYWHGNKAQKHRDFKKDRVLKKFGWRIIRLSEDDIVSNSHDCALRVLNSLTR